MIYKIYDKNMLSSVSGGVNNKLNLAQKAVLFGLSALCVVSPTFGLENNSTQIKNSIVTQKEQNTDSTNATTLKKRKFSFNKPDARALIESLGALGLIITVPWLAYEKLVVNSVLRSGAALAKEQVKALYANHVPIREYEDRIKDLLNLKRTGIHVPDKYDYRFQLWIELMTLCPTGSVIEAERIIGMLNRLPSFERAEIRLPENQTQDLTSPESLWGFLTELCDTIFADSATSEAKEQILKITKEMGFWKRTNADFIEWNKNQYKLNF